MAPKDYLGADQRKVANDKGLFYSLAISSADITARKIRKFRILSKTLGQIRKKMILKFWMQEISIY